MVAGHTWLALTAITATILHTIAVVLTRFIGAARDHFLTVFSTEAVLTHTSVATDFVATFPVVLTRTRKTFVNIERAIMLRIALIASTEVIILQVHAFLGALSPTTILLTLINVHFATLPLESRLAFATKVTDTVCAVATIKTSVLGAIVRIAIAVATNIAIVALTVELIDEVKTFTVPTRVRLAFIDIRLTISSCEPR